MAPLLVGILTAFISSVLFFTFQIVVDIIRRKRHQEVKEDESLRTGVQALLMANLESKHDEMIKKGFASYREKELYEKQYNAYHNLGKNGVMTAAYEEVMALPLNKPIKHTNKK